ncbi:TPA: hypothetical protein HA265_00225 [Candidatus Woesearchaeota archaeon]|nr:hypothetical protein [Candidatus Woesearchaeota archaeon]
MEKLKLYGTGNEDARSYFVFEKSLNFFPLFGKFLAKIRVGKPGSFYEYEDNALNLEDVTDSLENMRDELYDIDIFYGKERIIVTVRTKVPQETYLGYIKEIADF